MMRDSDTKAILDNLMARRSNSPEFTHELEGYADDLASGELDNADKKYIRDLAKRLGRDGTGSDDKGVNDALEADDSAPDDEWDDSDDEDHENDKRFARAKAAFHERFHPDNLDPDAADTALRREIYEEFWAELERIEDED